MPRGHVYSFHLDNLQHIYEWSSPRPGKKIEDIEFIGKSGTVGSKAHWKGKGSKGHSEIQKIIPLDSVEVRVRYLKPRESVNTIAYSIRGEGESCRVTCHLEGHDPFPFNIRHLFIQADHIHGGRIESSLESLKQVAIESHKSAYRSVVVDTLPQRTMKVVQRLPVTQENLSLDQYPFEDDLQFIEEKMYLDPGMYPVRLYFRQKADSVSLLFLMSKVPKDNPSDDETIRFAPQVVARTVHRGLMTSRSEHIIKLRRFVKTSGHQAQGSVEERFIKGYWNEPDTAKWRTELLLWIHGDVTTSQ